MKRKSERLAAELVVEALRERDDLRAKLAEIEKRQEWANPTERDDLRAALTKQRDEMRLLRDKLAAAEAHSNDRYNDLYDMSQEVLLDAEKERDAALARANKAEWKYEEGHLVWIDTKKERDAALARAETAEAALVVADGFYRECAEQRNAALARVKELEEALREVLPWAEANFEWGKANRVAAVDRARRVLEKTK